MLPPAARFNERENIKNIVLQARLSNIPKQFSSKLYFIDLPDNLETNSTVSEIYAAVNVNQIDQKIFTFLVAES